MARLPTLFAIHLVNLEHIGAFRTGFFHLKLVINFRHLFDSCLNMVKRV